MKQIPECLGYQSDASVYADAILKAKTHDDLLAAVAPWNEIFPDAWEQANAISDWDEFNEYNQKLARKDYRQRSVVAKIERLTLKYGAILCPLRAIQAGMVAERFGAPWGCALIRLLEVESQ